MAEPRPLNPYIQSPVPGIRQPILRPSTPGASSTENSFTNPLDIYTPSSAVPDYSAPTVTDDTFIDQSQASYPQDNTGSLGSDAFIGLTQSGLMNGQNVRWLLVNFSGLKWSNDHWGHEAGNAYLLRVKAILEEVVGAPVQIVRQGPNFAILLPQDLDAAAVMRGLELKLRSGVDFSYLRRHRDGRTEIIPANYSTATEGRSRIFNQELLVYDASQEYSLEGIFAGLREETYYLNRPEMEFYRHTTPQLIGGGHFQMVVLDPQRLSTLNLNDRLVKSEVPAHREDSIGSLTESRSGAENVRALDGDALNLLLENGQMRLAVIDLNAIGAFRSLGPLGDLMIDAVLEVRVLEAAKTLEGTGITLYRHGGGSEEYYLAGDVSEEQMAAATRLFLEALNAEPLVLRIDVSDLESTAMGRQTLEYLKQTGQYQPYQHTFENGQSAQVVDVDLTRVVRGSLQPDGTYKTFIGLTGTAAIGEIRRPADGETLEVRPEFRDHRFGEILEVIARGRESVMDLVEKAKWDNAHRDNLVVKAGQYRGTATLFRDGADGVSPDNVMTFISHFRSGIPFGEVELYTDRGGRISFEPGAGLYPIQVTIIEGPHGAPYLQSLEVREELRAASPRTVDILGGSLARMNQALLRNVINWLGNSGRRRGRQLAEVASEINQFTREHPVETDISSSTPTQPLDRMPRPQIPILEVEPRADSVSHQIGGPLNHSGSPDGVMAPTPAAPSPATPSVNDLYTRIMSIGPNNQPWYMSLIPAEIAATYSIDQISVAIEGEQIIIEAHPSGQPVSFRIALKVYPEGGFIEITDIDVMLTGGVGESNFAAQELTVINRLLEGLRQIGTASQGAYQDIFINGVNSYYELYALAWSGFGYIGDEATAAQVRAQVAQIENQVLQAIVDGQIDMIGDRAQDLVTINQYIIDNNLWPTDLQMGGSITADAIPPIGAEQWSPVAASAVPSTPRVPIEPGQTMIYYYNSTWFYSVTMAADGQSVTLSNKWSTIEIHEGVPDIGAEIRPFMIYLSDGQLYMADQSKLPPHQATSKGRPLQMGETIVYYRDAIDPTIDYQAGIAQQVHLPGTAEIFYLGYKYTLLSLPEGHIQITRQSPSGEVDNLGELGPNESIGPFFAGPNGVVFFPYEVTSQEVGLVSPGPEAIKPAIAVEAARYDHGLYTATTYLSLNRYLLSVGRAPTWVSVNLDLGPIGSELSEAARDQIQAKIYERLWQIAHDAGISSPIIVLHDGGFAINVPDILSAEVQLDIIAALNQGLDAQFSDAQLVHNAEGGAALSLIRVQAADAKPVNLDPQRTYTETEMLQALDTTSSIEPSVTIVQIPVRAEGVELAASYQRHQARVIAAGEREKALGMEVGEIVLHEENFELWSAGGELLNLNGIMVEYPVGQLPTPELRQTILEAIGTIHQLGVPVGGILIENGHFILSGTNGEVLDIRPIPSAPSSPATIPADHGMGRPVNPDPAPIEGIESDRPRRAAAGPRPFDYANDFSGTPPVVPATPQPATLVEPFTVADGHYQSVNVGEGQLRITNVGGRYMAAVGPEGSGRGLEWQPLPLTGEELALDGGRVRVRLENGNILVKTVDIEAALTESFSALLKNELPNLRPGSVSLIIENGQVRIATARELPDAFLTVMPEGFEDLKYRIGNEAAEMLAPYLAGQEEINVRGLIRALRKFRDRGEVTGELAELNIPVDQLAQLRAQLVEVHGEYVAGRIYRLEKIEEAIQNGEAMDQATIEANLETLRRIAAQPNLAALIGADRLAVLQTKLEAKLSAAAEPTPPASPTANPIATVLMNEYHLSAEQVGQVMRLFAEQGLNEQEFTSKLAEIAPDLAANIDQLKEKLNQAILADLSARAVNDPALAAHLQEQFALHGGRLGISDLFSEIGQEYLQEDVQGGAMGILGSNSPALQFLLEPMVEGEFWTSMARGQFGALKQFFSTAMPATGAGIVGANVYNLILNLLGVSQDSAARGVLPQVTVGVISAMGYSAGASGAMGRTLARLLSNPVTQRIFVALALNAPITDGVSRLLGTTEEFEVGARIAQREHPTAYGVLSFLGKEFATMILNIFDSDASYNYEMALVDQSVEAEITGQNVMDALSALTLLYVARNPIFLNPELYGGQPVIEVVENPELNDTAYFQQLLGQYDAARSGQETDLDVILGEENADLFDPTPQTNPAELAYALLVGIHQGQDLTAQRLAFRALGMVDEDGNVDYSNQYVRDGQILFDERSRHIERQGLVAEVGGAVNGQMAEALASIQAADRKIDEAQAVGLAPSVEINLPHQLLGDSRGNLDETALMNYLLVENNDAIWDISTEQRVVYFTVQQVSRALAGEAVDIDFSDPTVQSVLKYLLSHLPSQP